MSAFLSLSVAVFVALFLWQYGTSRKQHRPYPPGPKPKPFIGNALDFPTKDVADGYIEWGKKYNSSIIHASALGNHVVVLNKFEDVVELFERRATKYSDRPEYPILNLMSWDHSIALQQYGEGWRYHRKICQQNFNKGAVKNYHSIMLQKVHAMLYGLLKSPEKFEHHNRMLAVSIPMKTMYGYDVESIDDPCIAMAEKSLDLGLPLLVPGGSLINTFPFLAYVPVWFPGASSRKVAAEVKHPWQQFGNLLGRFFDRRIPHLTGGICGYPTHLISRWLLFRRSYPSFVDGFGIQAPQYGWRCHCHHLTSCSDGSR